MNDYAEALAEANSVNISQSAAQIAINTAAIAAINAGPKGIYATSAALTTAFPTGNSNIYIVSADGKWYYWNGSAWTAGAVYQATGIPDYSISSRQFSKPMVIGTASKNLFDKTDIVSGKYISNTTGNESANGSCTASNFIPVPANSAIKISGTTQQGAFYNASKVYVSGYTSTSTLSAVPSTAAYIRASMLTTEINAVQVELSSTATPYEVFAPRIDLSTIRDTITQDKLDVVMIRGTIKNLFNKNTITAGYYVRASDGALIALTSCSASDYISVAASTGYYVSGTSQQGAFYDSSKTFISGQTNMHGAITTPSNCAYVRLTMLNAEANSLQIELGTSQTAYESGPKVDVTQVRNYVITNTITVDINGTGNFTDLSAAVASAANPGSNNIYNINILPGTYDVFAHLTTAELAGSGIMLPDYANLIGVGNGVILKGEIPSISATLDNTTRISTINVQKTNTLKNLTITAKNMRYPVHDESSNVYTDWKRIAENCLFIHYGNDAGMWAYATAYGEGCSTGSDSRFKNCNFVSNTINPAYGMHNNVSFINPSYHEFENCNFTNLVTGGVAARFGSMGSGQKDRVVFKGCNYTGLLKLHEELANGCGIDYDVDGFGNQGAFYTFTYTNAGYFKNRLHFSDEVYQAINLTGSTITNKSVVLQSAGNQISVMGSGDAAVRFYGIAIEDITTGNYGLVRRKGYISIADTNLASANVGDKIGITAGVLAVVSSGDYIGVCDVAGYIRLS
jgi:hypothetical protein